MERNFKTYFFRVEVEGERSFENLLRTIAAIPLEERTIEVSDSPVRLEDIDLAQARGGLIGGDMERVQMGNFPTRSKLRERSAELEFDDDEGLGHQTAFLYDARNRVLALQGNLTGVGGTRFKNYLNYMFYQRIPNSLVDFHVVMLPDDDTARAYGPDAEFRKLTFSVTDPNSVAETLENLEGEIPIASTMLRTPIGDEASIRMTVTLSAGRSPANLNRGYTQRFLRAITRAHQQGANVEKLAALGEFGGENAELNFLPTKLAHTQRIELSRSAIPYPLRRGFLQVAMRERAAILARLFRRDEGVQIA
jgi:hypothetical protein